MIRNLTKAYIRHYSDNGQTKIYFEWIDSHGKAGRTEGDFGPDGPIGWHLSALINRAKREGIFIERERW